jgi:hypothetical protein
MGPGGDGPVHIGVGDPDVDVDIVFEGVGERDELDVRRKIAQKFSGQCGRVTDS